jgi:transposase
MSKLRIEERIAAAQAVEAGESIGSVARRYKINRRPMSYIVGLYQGYGEAGLRKHAYGWTAEQKYQVLKYMHENELTCRETGIKFGISGSATIWQWEQRYLENGIEGLENKKKGRKSRVQIAKLPKTKLEELEEENLNLRIENEYLKKLNALVAEREKREKGIK